MSVTLKCCYQHQGVTYQRSVDGRELAILCAHRLSVRGYIQNYDISASIYWDGSNYLTFVCRTCVYSCGTLRTPKLTAASSFVPLMTSRANEGDCRSACLNWKFVGRRTGPHSTIRPIFIQLAYTDFLTVDVFLTFMGLFLLLLFRVDNFSVEVFPVNRFSLPFCRGLFSPNTAVPLDFHQFHGRSLPEPVLARNLWTQYHDNEQVSGT